LAFVFEAFELFVEGFELIEVRLSHEVEDGVAGVFGGDFEAAGDVVEDDFAEVVVVVFVDAGILRGGGEEVVADAAADEGFFDAGEGVDGLVKVEQGAVVGIEVGADAGVDAGRFLAGGANAEVAAFHAVHVGGGAAEVGEVAFEIGAVGEEADFAEDGGFAAVHDEFALVGGDGAEGTAAEAAAVDVHREFDHLVGGDGLVFVFGVGQAGVGKFVAAVQFVGGEGWKGWVYNQFHVPNLLNQDVGIQFVGLLLDVAEILGLLAFAH